MSSPQSVTKNIVLGAGYLYFDEEDTSGNLTGESYMAETPGFSLNVSTEKTEIDSSDTPVAETLVSLVKKVTRGGQITTNNMDDATFARFIQGDESTVTQSGSSVTDEEHTVQQGRYYQLGASTSNPTGVRNVTSVTVTGTGGTPTHTLTTDYIVNADEGRIYIVPGGGIADDATIEVDYTDGSDSRTRVASSGAGAKRGAIRFIGDNTNGEDRIVYIPKAELAPNGDLAFKDRDNAMLATFDLNILTRTGYEQVYVDGVPA